MEIISKDVPQLTADERRAMEHLVGHPLEDRQRLVIQVVEPPEKRFDFILSNPPWGNVYEGMSDEEVERAHRSIIRSRPGVIDTP
jgi:predicted RNA methylase